MMLEFPECYNRPTSYTFFRSLSGNAKYMLSRKQTLDKPNGKRSSAADHMNMFPLCRHVQARTLMHHQSRCSRPKTSEFRCQWSLMYEPGFIVCCVKRDLWGTWGGSHLNHTGSHKNDVSPVRNTAWRIKQIVFNTDWKWVFGQKTFGSGSFPLQFCLTVVSILWFWMFARASHVMSRF